MKDHLTRAYGQRKGTQKTAQIFWKENLQEAAELKQDHLGALPSASHRHQ